MRRHLLVVLVVLGLLGGCGKEPPTTPATSAPEPTSTSTPTAAPAVPEAAKDGTSLGAVIFVQHYLSLINLAQATGQLESLAAVEDSGCSSCTKGRKYIQGVYGKGGHIEGGEIRSTLDRSFTDPAGNGWTVKMNLSFGPQIVVRPWLETSNEALNGGKTAATFELTRENGTWMIADWFRTS